MHTLRKKYGTSDPSAIKMRIMWNAIKQLVMDSYGDTPRNRKILKQADDDWHRAESAENVA